MFRECFVKGKLLPSCQSIFGPSQSSQHIYQLLLTLPTGPSLPVSYVCVCVCLMLMVSMSWSTKKNINL